MTTAADPELMARLAAHRTLGSAPTTEHEWLVSKGKLASLAVGDILTRKGEQSDALCVFFTGHVVIRADRGAGSHKIFEWHGGDVGGVLPYSRKSSPPADAVVEEATEFLKVPPNCLPDLARECPNITAKLVHLMLDRARQFNTADLRDEKLVSLGRLAAGLAHELNNPASAAVRSAKMLTARVAAAERAAMTIGEARLSDEQIGAIAEVRRQSFAAELRDRSPLQKSDDEERLVDWLDEHDVSDDYAAALADAGITTDSLDALAEKLSGSVLDAALCWIAAGVMARTLSSEIETAASRIYELVDGVKGFTFMDHAPTPEPIDIRRGINDTFMMLGNKIKKKNAEVSLEIPENLPRAHAVGAELNQVWMNLIDNALDAIDQGGKVVLSARRDNNKVVVTVTDDGAGIPKEIVGRIFEPFFTTKEVGKGTGMGLEIVRRILRRHEGDIDVESEPGKTQFKVILPIERA